MGYQSYRNGFRVYLQLERGLSMNTVEAYLHDIDLLSAFIEQREERISFIELGLPELREFLQFINSMDLGAATQSRIISGIKAFYKYLLLEKIVDTDPTELLDSPKIGQKLPEVLSVEEVTDIIESVDLSLPEGERDKAILETLYGCGLRVSELINIKINDLHFNEGIILVTGKGNKQRLVPIGEAAIKQIGIYKNQVRVHLRPKKNEDEYLFLNRRGARLSRQMIFIIVKRQAEKVGIQKTISPHSFRHSYATHLVQNGANLRAVQELLGHVSITTTEIYTHLNEKDLRDAILNFHPRYRGT